MKGWFDEVNCNNNLENGALIRKPTTALRFEGKTVLVKYNPGMMSAERATDLFMGGMALFCAPLYYVLGHSVMAFISAALAAYSIYDGLRRPAGEEAPRTEVYEKSAGEIVQYNPGLMTLERALALILSGFGLVEAACYLASGHGFVALLVLLVALWMFRGGIQRPQETARKLSAAKREQLEQRSE